MQLGPSKIRDYGLIQGAEYTLSNHTDLDEVGYWLFVQNIFLNHYPY